MSDYDAFDAIPKDPAKLPVVTGVKPAPPKEMDDYTMVPFARQFAIWAHGDQRYGEQRYRAHLVEVVEILDHHGYDVHYFPLAVITGWLHDVGEDTAVLIRDIANDFGDRVAELVWACTGVGSNRKERQASIKVKLLADPEAQPPKAADRLANMRSSLREKKRGLVSMYAREFDDFLSSVSHIKPSLHQALRDVQADSQAFLKETHA